MKLKIELQVHSTFKDRMETIETGANGERKNHLFTTFSFDHIWKRELNFNRL